MWWRNAFGYAKGVVLVKRKSLWTLKYSYIWDVDFSMTEGQKDVLMMSPLKELWTVLYMQAVIDVSYWPKVNAPVETRFLDAR